MTRRQARLTADDLKRYEANVKKIKWVRGGGVRSATDQTHVPGAKATTVSNRRGSEPPSKNRGAGINPAPSPKSPYDSKWEAAYHAKLQLEIQAGLIKQVWLHPFSLWLPGKVRYKPDFLIQYPDGMEQRLEITEVKGWSKNRRDGITRLKIAAALFPCFAWRMVYRTKGGGWDGEYL